MMQSTHGKVHPVTGLFQSFADVASDVIEVSELHVSLAREDARVASQKSMVPVALLACGASALMSALPVLGFGVAEAMRSEYGWTAWHAQLLVGCVMSIVGVSLIALSVFGLRKALSTFGRSVSELSKNVAWIKAMIRAKAN